MIELIEEFKDNNIFLSKIDLENDLYDVIADKMEDGFRSIILSKDFRIRNYSI